MFPFFNRENELRRLRRILDQEPGRLAVVYGRRRCGKSRLLQELDDSKVVYFLADQREAPLQRAALARALEVSHPGFGSTTYPDWESLLTNLHHRTTAPLTLCLGEFPNLVRSESALPSIFQVFIDRYPARKLSIILCGSAQQMMQGLVLDAAAPLFGRAQEIIRVHPLPAFWLKKAFPNLTAPELIEEYAVWGGVPRYWELRSNFKDLRSAVLDLLFDPMGVLYEEPVRLFLDEARSAVQPLSIMTLVGNGCHRLSEIAGRLEKPATQLTRPLAFLTQLRYLRREVPFGEPHRSSKKGIYTIADPFLAFYFRFMPPNRSELERGGGDQVWERLQSTWRQHVAEIWEQMCREAIPMLLPNLRLQPAGRWWGRKAEGPHPEIDLLAESEDKKTIVIGEVKWTDKVDSLTLGNRLEAATASLPFLKDRTLVKVLFTKSPISGPGFDYFFSSEDVINGLQ